MDEESARGPLAEKIAALMEDSGFTMADVSRRTGQDRSQMTRILSGQQRYLRPKTINALAKAFGIDPEELYDVAAAEGPLPSLPTYLRRKSGLTDKQITQIERAIGRMKRD